MTNQEIINYYANLLILQYLDEPKAYATMQALVNPVVMDQLPIQVQNAFEIGTAVGVQLDTLGKYAGVTRYGFDLNGNPITLNDLNFTSLIKIAIIHNMHGSSLYQIDLLLQTFFPNEVFCFDGADMQMSYLISSAFGNQDLVELVVSQNLLPKPMGVQLATITYITEISLFGFQTYAVTVPPWDSGTTYVLGQRVFTNGIVYASIQAGNTNHAVTDTEWWIAQIYPFNSYVTYPTYKPYKWLSYADGINI